MKAIPSAAANEMHVVTKSRIETAGTVHNRCCSAAPRAAVTRLARAQLQVEPRRRNVQPKSSALAIGPRKHTDLADSATTYAVMSLVLLDTSVTAARPRTPSLTKVLTMRIQAAQRACGCFVACGGDVTTPGVPSFGVISGRPPEHLAAAPRSIGPAVSVLQNFAFEDALNDSAKALSTLAPTAPIDSVIQRSWQSCAK